MNVKLVALTTPVVDGVKTAEDLIVYCARVSNPSNQLNLDTGSKLISYCIRNKHWSIFEQASMTVEIKTSRAIATQILRHRSFSFQEYSQRYAEVTELEPIEFRKQGTTNRQGGEELCELNPGTAQRVDGFLWEAKDLYKTLLGEGVAKECARFLLPVCAQTTLYMTGTIRSWIHFLDVRTEAHTQKEHRLIANKIKEEIFKKNFPNISLALGF